MDVNTCSNMGYGINKNLCKCYLLVELSICCNVKLTIRQDHMLRCGLCNIPHAIIINNAQCNYKLTSLCNVEKIAYSQYLDKMKGFLVIEPYRHNTILSQRAVMFSSFQFYAYNC